MDNSQVMNMLIGVLVEVVSVTAQVDKEETAMKVAAERINGATEYLAPQNHVILLMVQKSC